MQSILYITGHFFSTVIKPIEKKEKKARKGKLFWKSVLRVDELYGNQHARKNSISVFDSLKRVDMSRSVYVKKLDFFKA